MSYIMRTEAQDFCKALSKLTKEFGIVIDGQFHIEAINDDEMSDFDYYSPDAIDQQKIEYSLHGEKAS